MGGGGVVARVLGFVTSSGGVVSAHMLRSSGVSTCVRKELHQNICGTNMHPRAAGWLIVEEPGDRDWDEWENPARN